MNFWKRHVGDLAKACGHLSQGQMGAYDLLLDWLYGNEKPLPHLQDALYRIGRAQTKPERANVDAVIREFFTMTPDGYIQKRASEEIAKAHAIGDTNRRIAEEREARKRAEKEARTVHEACNESLNGLSTNGQPSQTPDSRQEQEAKAPAAPAVDFRADLFRRWKALPDGGGAAYLTKLMRDHKPEQRVLEAVERTLSETRADPKGFVQGVLRAEHRAETAHDDLMLGVR